VSDAGEVTRSNEVSRLNRIVVLLTLALTTGLLADSGDTPLIDAVKRGDHNAVRTQLRGKIDVNAPGVDGTTALHWAVRGDDAELVTMLLRAGANPKSANRYGLAPITLAAMNGSAKVIDLLVSAGVDANTSTTEGEPVIMTAARTGAVTVPVNSADGLGRYNRGHVK